MKDFINSFTVQAPLSSVAEFHSDTRALKRLTPPPVIVRFNSLEPLGEGSRADFTLWFGPLPIRWVAIHHEYNPLKGFVDVQESGPFEFWEHRHSFKPISDNCTEIIDEIKASPSQHPFWSLVGRFMWLNLPIMFAYRAWVTRRFVEG